MESELNVQDVSEIDWNVMRGPDLDNWSAHALQRRWTKLKAKIEGFEDKTHQEIVGILSQQFSKLQGPEDCVSTNIQQAAQIISPEAGNSTGPDMHTQQG